MSFNRLAVYGHRGWASGHIVQRLALSGAPLKILYRPGSDIASMPSHVTTVEVDVADRSALVEALQDVDILISLVGHEGVPRQHSLIEALPSTSVKLFVPSDMGFRCDDQGGLRIPINEAKRAVENAAKAANTPLTIVLPGCLAESSFSIPMMGVDVARNLVVHMGDSAHEKLSVSAFQQVVKIYHAEPRDSDSTIAYVAAGYSALFARTPLGELENKIIGLSEMQVTGDDMASALAKKHGASPQILHQGVAGIDEQINACIEHGSPLALAWYCRKMWATGKHMEAMTANLLDVPDYTKATLDGLIVRGEMGAYRDLPTQVVAMFESMQDMAAA